MKKPNRNHSVMLDEDACKGCTVCVTTCPAEAIRVRNGKALIISERCIDCGECIRRCRNHAKQARSDSFRDFMNSGRSKYDWTIVLPAPSLYGQFPEKYSIGDIHQALLMLGFDDIFPVSAATSAISEATLQCIENNQGPQQMKPLISSSCPTIIKFIQSRFPTLIDHIVPVIAPMELAGRLAREKALTELREKGKKKPRIGVFFISPCPGKITESMAPVSGEDTGIDGVFSMRDIHVPGLTALGKITRGEACFPLRPEEIAWGRTGGEAEAALADKGYSYMAVDGIEACTRVLEAVEDGLLNDIDFLELMACPGGCVGGALTVSNSDLAKHSIRQKEEKLGNEKKEAGDKRKKVDPSLCMRKGSIPEKSAFKLDSDYKKAVKMMEEMEEIYKELPGLDCGCCGAPNCHALAEDIVKGNASLTDCVIILKEQYRNLLGKEK
ncbi:4Fe-4S dicluster domain-containing protein [Brucepastera parasyntrophica]|uniref:[Fe-Fe] hydrogenase large subunit C-terminal domain-containing protein n=1 Tax=Brucepastera parasyntrophica TaxID=2880008 RepID=UPI00210A3504|nr:[Fe-Fe] hydrogenase large subunit C-terminal domain-containing protein [Brucepastera parasyntrophica]ULQ60384.1 4Fe-4S dicluster domain-containing protein [Brucepastera parasyntrophica]